MNWLREHWEMLSAFGLGAFGFGGIYSTQREHEKKIGRLEIILEKEIPEIKDILSRIDERTKHL